MRYSVVLIRSDEGYAVGCPSLPGCWTQGETRAEALENIGIAIREVLEVRAGVGIDPDSDEVAAVEIVELEVA